MRPTCQFDVSESSFIALNALQGFREAKAWLLLVLGGDAAPFLVGCGRWHGGVGWYATVVDTTTEYVVLWHGVSQSTN
jgi:hypothetical protein